MVAAHPDEPDDPGLRKFRKDLAAGTVALVLLGVLARAGRPVYGYEIAKRIEAAAGGEPAVKLGTLYPVLRALEADGMLGSHTEPSVAGPPRRYYRITDAGHRTLAAWTRAWTGTRELVERVLRDGIELDERSGEGEDHV